MVENLTPEEAWSFLQASEDTWLIDVRTPNEWTCIGVPDLKGAGSRLVLLSWRLWPAMEINPMFVAQLDERIPSEHEKLLFLCRSGGRSLAAAEAARKAGRQHTYNILNGFEGDLDAAGHRSSVGGWKFASLPWRQS